LKVADSCFATTCDSNCSARH